MFEKGVSWYTRADIHLPVFFPEDMTVCQWCPHVRYEDGIKRHRCALTGEYLPYPFLSRGNMCPAVDFRRAEEDNTNYRDKEV